jgi:hypothetical protein
MVGASLTNTASGGAGTGAITYQSSNTNVLTVNATSGLAMGVAIGAATVTATKAADAGFTQAQATYTVSVQTTAPMSAWINVTDSQVTLPQLALGKQFVRAPVATCTTPANVGTCPDAESDAVTATAITDGAAKLNTQAYYQLTAGTVAAAPVVVAAQRFSERIGHAALFFNNRYWVIAGGEPLLPNNIPAAPIQHIQKEDVWSSADGKNWKLETEHAAFGERWFHQAVVYDGAMWVISGANRAGPFLTDAWSSTDGVNWTQRATNIGLPWYSTHLNVTVFGGAMWAISGGASFSSTDGATWTPRSAFGAIGGNNGRGYASLSVYDDNLWYIGGAPGLNPQPGDLVSEVWKSSDGISWTLVGTPAFPVRYRHAAFALNGRLWVFGGQTHDGFGDFKWALDAWSSTDGIQWREESTRGLDSSYLAKVVERSGPDQVILIGGIQRGYSNNVWQTTDGRNWTSLSSQARFSPRATRGVSFNGQLWIIGGATIDRPEGGVSNEIWRSADGIDWTRVVPTTIFPPRDGHSIVVFQNKLWVIGGWEGSLLGGGNDVRLNDVWSSSDGVAWTQQIPAGGTIFARRVSHDVAVFQDKLWVIGGHLQNSADTNDVWSSPDGLTWTLVQANAAFSARRSHRVVAFHNELWLTGGGSGPSGEPAQGTSEVWHSPDGITWTQVNPPFPFFPRLRHAMEVFGDRLIVIGGASGEDYATSTLYSDIRASSDGINWIELTVEERFAPRSASASMVHGGELWLVGGFGLSFFNDVWRSSDGRDWRVGFSHDIVVP